MNKQLVHFLHGKAKENITESIISLIGKKPGIVFAYLHGSFTENLPFGDIDIAVYLDRMPESCLDYELALEIECMNVLEKYPVDVRILNNAPLSFQYNVIKSGRSIAVHDDEARSEFQEKVMERYFDFDYFRNRYLKEAVSAEV